MAGSISFRDFIGSELRARLNDEAWTRAEALLARKATAEHLLAHLDELGAPPPTLALELAHAWRAFARWRDAAAATKLPDAGATRSLIELRAFERVAAALPDDSPRAAALDVLRASIAETLEGARIHAAPAREPEALLRDPRGREALDATGNAPATDLPNPRWLAWRRHQREGLLHLHATLPDEALAEQVTVRAPAEHAEPIRAAVRDALEDALFAALDARAQEDAFEQASRALLGLLRTPPLQARRVGAIFIGAARQPLGAVCVDAQGQLQASTSLPAEPWWAERLKTWIGQQRADAWVLPTSALDRERLTQARDLLPAAPVVVKPAGVNDAREALTDAASRLPREVQTALILARRALAPFDAWTAIDPVALGIAEYQNDLDEALLRGRLEDTIALARHTRDDTTAAPALTAAPTAARLNPLVRGLDDVRPGMVLDVQITNLTTFGAFATFGLDTEGLIHISELADHRVQSPSDVVHIGQRLRARVLEVDLPRKRVSLSLRADNRPPSRTRQDRGKADALSKLNDLFKK